jgi:hypothetical protein
MDDAQHANTGDPASDLSTDRWSMNGSTFDLIKRTRFELDALERRLAIQPGNMALYDDV